MRDAREQGGLALLLLLAACGPGSGVVTNPGGQAPEPDGHRVIKYDVEVTEDDSRCNARIPYKHSSEEMTIVWHTDREITMFVRGGLYEKEVTLDENGEYTQDGTAGVCLPGSTVWGRVDRQSGEATALCRKRECDVYFYSKAKARPVAQDAGPGSDG